MAKMEEADQGNESNLRDQSPDLRDYGKTVWRHRWLIIATIALAVCAALAISALQTPVYEATAQIIIQPSGAQQILNGARPNAQDAARNVNTETAVLRSKVVQDAATKSLGHRPDIKISNSASSDVIGVSARSTDARRAAADANGYATAYAAFRRDQTISDLSQAGQQVQAKIAEIGGRLPALAIGSPERSTAEQQRASLQQQLDELQVSANLDSVGGARVLASAGVPSDPILPKPVRNVGIALVLGALVGIGLAFLWEYLDDTITSREDLERAASDLPVLGQIPRPAGRRSRKAAQLVTFDAPNSPAAEAYRTLRTSIGFLGIDRPVKCIQVTSSRADEGKSIVLANLAIAFARAGRKVTIVCLDLRTPRIQDLFGVSNSKGFTTVAYGVASVDEVLQRIPGEENAMLLAAGPCPSNPSEILTSSGREVLEAVLRCSDVVLVDSAPVLPGGDALIVSGMVDATLLAATAKSSSTRDVNRSVEVLGTVAAPLVGAVLLNAQSSLSYPTSSYMPYMSSPVPGRQPTTRVKGRKSSRATSEQFN